MKQPKPEDRVLGEEDLKEVVIASALRDLRAIIRKYGDNPKCASATERVKQAMAALRAQRR